MKLTTLLIIMIVRTTKCSIGSFKALVQYEFAGTLYLLVLQVCGELIALREGVRALDGLLLGLLAEDGLRVL